MTIPRRAWALAGVTCAAMLAASARMAAAANATPSAAAGPWSFDAFFTELRDLRPDPQRVARVAGTLLERDAGTFALEEGTLALCSQIGGRVCAAVFVGRGSFAFVPGTEVERDQLRRLYGTPLVRKPFDALVLLFADSTREELEGQLEFRGDTPPPECRAALRRCLDDISHEPTRTVDGTLAQSLLERRGDGHFFAALYTGGGTPLYFEIDPYSTEEVLFMRRPPGPPATGVDRVQASRQIVSSLRRGGRSSDDLDGDVHPDLEVGHVTADLRLDSDLDVRAWARLEGRVRADTLAFLCLYLYSKLTVDSARVNGRPIAVARGKGGRQMWLQLEPPARAGDSLRVEVHYHGPMVEREGDWFWLPVVETWLPHRGGTGRSTYDLTFHHPKTFQLASVSERVSSETRGEVTTSRWVCARPVQYAAFNVGFMAEHEVVVEGLPKITVQMSSRHHDEWTQELGREGVASGRDMEKQVGADVANSLSFFQKVYGPLPVEHFFATETPIAHGISFPGMIALYAGTFQVQERYGQSELFRAHEVAHQWWPYGVGPKSYHDVWLSEGLAEFSALWFLQASRPRSARYFELLETWRREIVDGQQGKPGSGLRVGPTWLGSRTAVCERGDAYSLAVYRKGAWILHMLRNLLLDLDSMNEDRFRALMRDFQERYRGREASTQDFRRLAEEHAGQDLGWFFRQWVYGADIPAYRFAWKAEPDSVGRFVVHCRVEQRGVPETFRMAVPILVDLGEKGHARTRVEVRGARSEFDLPPVPAPPNKVVFNDLASVLCEVEAADWK